jgi:hypothetical protein
MMKFNPLKKKDAWLNSMKKNFGLILMEKEFENNY